MASGRMVVAAAPVQSETLKQAAKPTTQPEAKPLLPQAPTDEKAIWERVLDELKKNDPPVFALLKKERFIGAKGNVYQVVIPQSKKDFSYVRLNQQARREKISQVLSDVAGKKLMFEAVLESDAASQKMDAVRTEAQKSLIETFGRENVQIDEGKKL